MGAVRRLGCLTFCTPPPLSWKGTFHPACQIQRYKSLTSRYETVAYLPADLPNQRNYIFPSPLDSDAAVISTDEYWDAYARHFI